MPRYTCGGNIMITFSLNSRQTCIKTMNNLWVPARTKFLFILSVNIWIVIVLVALPAAYWSRIGINLFDHFLLRWYELRAWVASRVKQKSLASAGTNFGCHGDILVQLDSYACCLRNRNYLDRKSLHRLLQVEWRTRAAGCYVVGRAVDKRVFAFWVKLMFGYLWHFELFKGMLSLIQVRRLWLVYDNLSLVFWTDCDWGDSGFSGARGMLFLSTLFLCQFQYFWLTRALHNRWEALLNEGVLVAGQLRNSVSLLYWWAHLVLLKGQPRDIAQLSFDLEYAISSVVDT